MKKKSEPLKKSLCEVPENFPVELILCSKIHPSLANERKNKTEGIDDLLDSIKAQGLLHAITVRPDGSGDFEIVAGERRWRAVSKLYDKIPAIVRELTYAQANELRFVENVHRGDLTPLEEAAGVRGMLDEGRDAAEIADRLGKPVSWVARRAQLTNLSKTWLKAIKEGTGQADQLSGTHLEVLARFEPHIQDKIFDESNGILIDCTVVELRRKLAGYILAMSSANWKLDDESLSGIGACLACQKRTSKQMNLFDFAETTDCKGKEQDNCLDTECWNKKKQAFIERKASELREKNPDLVLIDRTSYYARQNCEGNSLKEQAVPEYKTTAAKKTDPGAKQALVIDGDGAGQIVYVKSSSKPESVAGGQKTLDEKRAQLKKRRRIRFVEKIIEILEGKNADHPVPQIGENISNIETHALVCAFGAGQLKEEGDYEFDRWKVFDAVVKLDGSTAMIDVLYCVFETIAHDLQQTTYGDPDRKFGDQVLQALKIDSAPIWQIVIDETPEPKAWAKMEAEEKPTKKTKKVDPCTVCKALHPSCDKCCKECEDACNGSQNCHKE